MVAIRFPMHSTQRPRKLYRERLHNKFEQSLIRKPAIGLLREQVTPEQQESQVTGWDVSCIAFGHEEAFNVRFAAFGHSRHRAQL